MGTFLGFHELGSVSIDGWRRTRMKIDILNPLLASAYIMSLNLPVAETNHMVTLTLVKEEWPG